MFNVLNFLLLQCMSCKGHLGCGSPGHMSNPWIWSHVSCTQPIIWVMSNAWNWATHSCVSKGQFTPWTMKSDHGRWPFSMVRLGGPISMVRFLKKSIYKAFGSLTRCKPNVDQEVWPCTKSDCVDFFLYMPQNNCFEKNSSLTILLSSLVFILSSPKKIHWK